MLQLLYFEQDANGGYGLGLQVISMFSFCSTCTRRSLCIAFCRLCCVILKREKRKFLFFFLLSLRISFVCLKWFSKKSRKKKGKLSKSCLFGYANLILDWHVHVIDNLIGMSHALISYGDCPPPFALCLNGYQGIQLSEQLVVVYLRSIQRLLGFCTNVQ